MELDDHIYCPAERDWSGKECAVCGRQFDQDEWQLEGHAGDAWGGSALYSCPNDDCDGTATVLY